MYSNHEEIVLPFHIHFIYMYTQIDYLGIINPTVGTCTSVHKLKLNFIEFYVPIVVHIMESN